ncbi:SDR family oxidoreductase [Microbacterium sp. NPDC057659]|uniref:SDR family oxidoreductase n=1 Tax=Microbacterium sp. NPDC057659 TaxID=3346198 RepID=UPI00366D0DFF
MDVGIAGRTALITGAAGGIGRAAARAFAAEGAHVALLDRDAAALDALAAELSATGIRASAHPADLTDEAQVSAAVSAATSRHRGLDAVIGCAGISGPVGTPLADTPASDWDAVFAVNVRGAFLVLRAAIPALRASDAASAVFVASDSALVAAPGMAPYCASKAALLQLVRAASVELSGDGIRVTAVCPSIVDTPMSRGDLGIREDDPDGFTGSGYPVQSAEEVAAQLVFLASPVSRPVNGTALVSDFGYTARSGFPA